MTAPRFSHPESHFYNISAFHFQPNVMLKKNKDNKILYEGKRFCLLTTTNNANLNDIQLIPDPFTTTLWM